MLIRAGSTPVTRTKTSSQAKAWELVFSVCLSIIIIIRVKLSPWGEVCQYLTSSNATNEVTCPRGEAALTLAIAKRTPPRVILSGA